MHFKFPHIAKEGHIFILICAVATVIAFVFSGLLGLIVLFITVCCALFFRDPQRITPELENAVIAPADGTIQSISLSSVPKDLNMGNEEMLKISIFMSVFNVHMNRSPVDGMIRTISYIPGKFLNASLDKASEYNERQSFVIESPNGQQIIMVQIAGLIARRIVKFVDEETCVKAGEKIGLIRFGSKVDIYLPKDTVPLVIEGQTAIGGETVLAYLGDDQPAQLTGYVADRANHTA